MGYYARRAARDRAKAGAAVCMTARYDGVCAETGKTIRPGDQIQYDRATKRSVLLQPGGQGRYISDVIRTSGGAFYRNKNGRCEDAPCCGCCTI